MIRPGTPFADNDNAPSSVRLRFAVAAVMRKVVQPDIARSTGSLHSKWERLRTNPRELANVGPATTWPEHQDEEESLGEYNILQFIFTILLTKLLLLHGQSLLIA
jgi:hypothetical protein